MELTRKNKIKPQELKCQGHIHPVNINISILHFDVFILLPKKRDCIARREN